MSRIKRKNRDFAISEDMYRTPKATYAQDSRGPRAQVRITPERSIITLFATADASSFIHESAHIWLNDIFQYAKEGTLNEQYQEEWNTLTEWLGIAPDQEQLTTEQHEKFARSFEPLSHGG